ncbi:hypothetical protein DMN91_004321 [Ooceraea biroi]|uniref:Transmembrane protein n=1 Tax=Ooceraea biroi TaxID=2015173 RepID=A0A3L8DUY0_OOCBI|nr:uncharacterized protein LOC105283591 [Ooceraea biroi]RLU24112.1 hypothetical protein DMN91_004321 [Ooceraea biroi]
MSRGSRTSRERRSTVAEPLEQDDSEDEASVRAATNNSHARRDSTPLQKRWSSSEESNQPYSREIKSLPLKGDNTEDTETESPDVKSNDEPHRSEKHARGKARYSDVHASEERIAKSLGERRRKRSKRIERRKLGERPRTADRDRDRTDTGSSTRRYNGESSLTDKSRKRDKNISRGKQADDEMPITEILKKAQENARTKYEEPVPLLELSTDTIYIQGRSGFSAVKIGGFRRALENDTTRATKGGMADDRDFAETQTHTLIRVAITAQKFWKRTGLVYQGLLGGMALLHFMMIHFFFDTSREFVSNYSIFSEAYANIFSFLITLCVISIFDKFDLVRLDMDHLREIYADHAKTALSIPLYLVTFGLHQVSSKIDDQLALAHYYNNNETTWSNNTMSENFFDELNGWQKITTTKDLLAVFAWLFVALGTRDNMLLMHLESMEKYASDEESPT